ncbi:CTTNBP2 N-terminal-like protein [Teleopsis dalmanni]|uniref:CTTNBP2 N-terminal-like protein n=1 Tax=Teleopsis dalmanni TaxID=139649 RepID=UPI0018CEFE88|nr:CTTNBP2 N-terminal-like protein [Teleopsis dalmanni]
MGKNSVKELEYELTLLRTENESLKKQHTQQNVSSGNVSAVKSRAFTDETCASPMVNIAKIVQPTATVSSVPVSGPTTGIARSITPGQNIRTGLSTATVTSAVSHASAAAVNEISGAAVPSPAKMQPTATIQRAPGGKYSALAAAAASHSVEQLTSHPVPIAVPPVTVPAGARGVPPPIPPNKPVVPPKREPSLSRLGSTTLNAVCMPNTGTTSTVNTTNIKPN